MKNRNFFSGQARNHGYYRNSMPALWNVYPHQSGQHESSMLHMNIPMAGGEMPYSQDQVYPVNDMNPMQSGESRYFQQSYPEYPTVGYPYMQNSNPQHFNEGMQFQGLYQGMQTNQPPYPLHLGGFIQQLQPQPFQQSGMAVQPMGYPAQIYPQLPKKVNSPNPFENPLQPIQKRPPLPLAFANPYPNQQFIQKQPSGVKSVLNQFKTQDGSIDINKMMNTAGQVMNTFGQMSAMVKGFSGMIKV